MSHEEPPIAADISAPPTTLVAPITVVGPNGKQLTITWKMLQTLIALDDGSFFDSVPFPFEPVRIGGDEPLILIPRVIGGVDPKDVKPEGE